MTDTSFEAAEAVLQGADQAAPGARGVRRDWFAVGALAVTLVVLTVFFLSLIAYTLIFLSNASAELNSVVIRNLAVEQTAESLNSTILNIRSEIWNTMVFDLARRQDHVEWLNAQAKTFYQGLRDLSSRNPQFADTALELRSRFQGYYQFGSSILEMRSLDELRQRDGGGSGPLRAALLRHQPSTDCGVPA